MSPRVRASATASLRPLTPSLRYKRPSLVLTVLTEMPSRRAMSSLVSRVGRNARSWISPELKDLAEVSRILKQDVLKPQAV